MDNLINQKRIKEITDCFQALVAVVPLHAINTSQEHEKEVATLNWLLDAGASVEHSPLSHLASALGSLIGNYEDAQHWVQSIAPSVTLRFLMDQHHLSQSSLPEIGSRSVVSKILSGKLKLFVAR